MKKLATSLTKGHFILLLFLILLNNLVSAQITVSGQLLGNNAPMSGFAILASGTESKVAYTDANGNYSFSLQQGGSYQIKPLNCSGDPWNGITTYDIVLIIRHLNGDELLDSPYKIIAADANNSGSVDFQDSTELRKLILGITNELPGGSFRYLLKDYVFPDPTDPFNPPYQKSFDISNLQANISNVDFTGIRVGDINGSSITPWECSDVELPFLITGNVFRDQDLDCLYDNGEAPLSGWIVSASNGISTFYATTNQQGAYEIGVLPGTYDVSLTLPSNLWNACADTIDNVTASIAGNNAADFAVHPTALCPQMEVDISTAFLRRCFDNYYQVKYCNLGTELAEDVQVQVTLDPYMNFIQSSVPAGSVSGNTYTFDLGDVASNECGYFNITINLDCDAVLGQTHCVEATISPDDLCSLPLGWDGADLKVQGACNNGDAVFTITNQGASMTEPSSYIVVEDIVVMKPSTQNPFILNSGASEIITIPSNGKTIRFEANQPAGHPWSTKTSVAVEGCGTNPNGSFSTGFVNLFPQNDQSPFVDVDCQENIGAFDPNDKRGFPYGILEDHFIPLQQPIDYLIRFQNTGTDTAFTVIIRDTLDALLDAHTIRPLSSSHPYTFNLSSEGVAQFTFTNIMLPDSNINEPASHGFVKFVISPKHELEVGTRIENDAAIFFDFNEPVITNTTWHTLGSEYLSSVNIFSPALGLDVYPNPVVDNLNFLLRSDQSIQGRLTLYDTRGRVVLTQAFDHNHFAVKTGGLQPGYYLFKISTPENTLASGKLVKVD